MTRHSAIEYPEQSGIDDATLSVEYGIDLETWNSGPGQTVEVSRVDNGDGTETVITRMTVPAGAKGFLRLRVDW